MNRLLSVLMGLCLIALIFIMGCFGQLFADLAIAGGPFAYLLSAATGSLVGAFMTYFAATIAICIFTDDDCNEVIAYVISGVLFIASMILPIVSFHGMRPNAIHLNENAGALRKTALTFFKKVDANHNDTITEQELVQALNTSVLNKEEARVAEDINNRRSEVGHVIDQQTHVYPSGKTVIVTTTYTYGVNRQDLETYPARIKEKYKLWVR